ncbi:hypothetical protein TMU01_21710 [Tenuibacillus multivorans]|nr:hypothetical protein TMU01_21710 [Tenuibacillus multivorans]
MAIQAFLENVLIPYELGRFLKFSLYEVVHFFSSLLEFRENDPISVEKFSLQKNVVIRTMRMFKQKSIAYEP